jgi:hypothetical protein
MEKESSRFEISLADGRRFGKVDTIYRLGCTHAMRAVVKLTHYHHPPIKALWTRRVADEFVGSNHAPAIKFSKAQRHAVSTVVCCETTSVHQDTRSGFRARTMH